MNVINIATTNQGGGGKTQEVEFDLTTLEDSRKTYSRIIEAYADGSISEQKARCLGYLMSNFLPYWRLEKEVDFEKRLDEIEAAINESKL